MRQRKIIGTTLGELIVAVTDEVMPIIRNPSGVYEVAYRRSFSPYSALTSGHDENTQVIWLNNSRREK